MRENVGIGAWDRMKLLLSHLLILIDRYGDTLLSFEIGKWKLTYVKGRSL